ncbi:MAG: thioesterase family protein [Alphaproteobacteria bacterium]|nr:thioesterase family protein [Alphaproteobacteria bacterium]
MKKQHIFNFAVAYADTDASGIMYHARYIEIAERARSNWSKDMVIPKGDIGFVVRALNIKYMSPLLLNDEFKVETKTIKIGAASLEVEQKFVKDDKICAIMNITIAYIGEGMRPKAMPESIVKMLD